MCIVSDEHDDDEASRKKRRMAERAAAGFIVDDEQDEEVCNSLSKSNLFADNIIIGVLTKTFNVYLLIKQDMIDLIFLLEFF